MSQPAVLEELLAVVRGDQHHGPVVETVPGQAAQQPADGAVAQDGSTGINPANAAPIDDKTDE